MIVGVDFDGTVVTHEYPEIGRDIGATPVLEELISKGHKLVLNTMRSGEELKHAVQWFDTRGIPLFGVNVNPEQKSWTSSPKVYAHLYIDDAALGIPLIYEQPRPYVDWKVVRQMLINQRVL